MDDKVKAILEINREVFDEIKRSNSINTKLMIEIDILSILEADIISIVLMNALFYKKEDIRINHFYNYIKRVLQITMNRIFNNNIQKENYKKDSYALLIPNLKHIDIFNALNKNEESSKLVPFVFRHSKFSKKMNFISCESYARLSTFNKVYFMLKSDLNKIKIDIPIKLINKYKDFIDLFEESSALKKYIDNYLDINIKNSLIRISYLVSSAIDFQKRFNFGTLLVTNERESSTRAVIYGFKLSNINRTIAFQRGVIMDHPEVSNIITDKIIVDGLYFKNNLVKRGCNPNNIVVLGSPRIDYLTANSLKKKISKDHDKLVFLVITEVRALGVSDEYTFNYLNKVIGCVKEIPESFLILKAHPNQDNITLEKKVCSKLLSSNRYTIKHRENIFELIPKCDYVISEYSTVILEAISFNTPVLIPKFNDKTNDFLGVLNSGMVALFEDHFDIEKILYNDYKFRIKEEFLQMYFHKLDSKSSLRVWKYLENKVVQ